MVFTDSFNNSVIIVLQKWRFNVQISFLLFALKKWFVLVILNPDICKVLAEV